ncbi:MAG: hypothetical protein AAGI01_09410 [Myxococcota bacterium]
MTSAALAITIMLGVLSRAGWLWRSHRSAWRRALTALQERAGSPGEMTWRHDGGMLLRTHLGDGREVELSARLDARGGWSVTISQGIDTPADLLFEASAVHTTTEGALAAPLGTDTECTLAREAHSVTSTLDPLIEELVPDGWAPLDLMLIERGVTIRALRIARSRLSLDIGVSRAVSIDGEAAKTLWEFAEHAATFSEACSEALGLPAAKHWEQIYRRVKSRPQVRGVALEVLRTHYSDTACAADAWLDALHFAPSWVVGPMIRQEDVTRYAAHLSDARVLALLETSARSLLLPIARVRIGPEDLHRFVDPIHPGLQPLVMTWMHDPKAQGALALALERDIARLPADITRPIFSTIERHPHPRWMPALVAAGATPLLNESTATALAGAAHAVIDRLPGRVLDPQTGMALLRVLRCATPAGVDELARVLAQRAGAELIPVLHKLALGEDDAMEGTIVAARFALDCLLERFGYDVLHGAVCLAEDSSPDGALTVAANITGELMLVDP